MVGPFEGQGGVEGALGVPRGEERMPAAAEHDLVAVPAEGAEALRHDGPESEDDAVRAVPGDRHRGDPPVLRKVGGAIAAGRGAARGERHAARIDASRVDPARVALVELGRCGGEALRVEQQEERRAAVFPRPRIDGDRPLDERPIGEEDGIDAVAGRSGRGGSGQRGEDGERGKRNGAGLIDNAVGAP